MLSGSGLFYFRQYKALYIIYYIRCFLKICNLKPHESWNRMLFQGLTFLWSWILNTNFSGEKRVEQVADMTWMGAVQWSVWQIGVDFRPLFIVFSYLFVLCKTLGTPKGFEKVFHWRELCRQPQCIGLFMKNRWLLFSNPSALPLPLRVPLGLPKVEKAGDWRELCWQQPQCSGLYAK